MTISFVDGYLKYFKYKNYTQDDFDEFTFFVDRYYETLCDVFDVECGMDFFTKKFSPVEISDKIPFQARFQPFVKFVNELYVYKPGDRLSLEKINRGINDYLEFIKCKYLKRECLNFLFENELINEIPIISTNVEEDYECFCEKCLKNELRSSIF